MADQDVTINITATTDELKDVMEAVNDVFKQASDMAKVLAESVNDDVSGAMTTAAADAATLGTALEAAFSPLAIIGLADAIVNAADKLSSFISDTFIYTNAEKQAVEQIKAENKVLEELARKTKEANRQRELLKASSASEKDKLTLKFQMEDEDGGPDHLKQLLEQKKLDYKNALRKSQETEQISFNDLNTGDSQEITQLTAAAQQAAAQLPALSGEINILKAQLDAAGASAGALNTKLAKDQAQEAQQREREKEQALMQGFQRELDDLKMNHQVSRTEEQNFWLSKLEQVKQGTALYNQIYHQAAAGQQAIDAENQRAQESFARAMERSSIEIQKQNEKATEDALKAATKNNQAIVKALQEANAAKEQQEKAHLATMRSLEEQAVQDRVASGKISQTQALAELKALHDQEYREDLRALQKKLELAQNDPDLNTAQRITAISKINAQIEQLNDQHLSRMAADNQKSLNAQRQQYQRYFTQCNSMFNSALNGWIQGTETASQAFEKMFQNILMQLVNFVEQWIEKKIEMWVMDEIISRQGNSSRADAAIQADVAQIEADANLAAAQAYSANAYDPIQAGIASAAAFAAVNSFAAAASATSILSGAGGIYRVPFDTVAMIHRDEQVLPASYAQGLRDLVGNGSASAAAVHVHLNVNAIDAASFQQTISRHGHMIGEQVYKTLRKRKLAG